MTQDHGRLSEVNSESRPVLSRKKRAELIVNSIHRGVSFSVKTCNDYGINWQDALNALIDAGVQRFRIMSYWDLHQPTDSDPDFSLLDSQLEIIRTRGCIATLCIGMRQPRWPETHVPKWALELDIDSRTEKYLVYHQHVIERYKDNSCIESWQLENEFWNKSFGLNNTFSRKRLKTEFSMIRTLDPEKPIIMSLANTVGYPVFGPRPDIYGTTMYLIQYEDGRYSTTKYQPWYFTLRALLLKLLVRRPLIIHELQAEPWGPKANWEMSDSEQAKSMNPEQLKRCVDFAKKSNIAYADLWGGEWWYWRKTTARDAALWTVVQSEFAESRHYT